MVQLSREDTVARRTIFRVSFVNRGEVYEVYAKSVSQGSLFGFVEIEGLLEPRVVDTIEGRRPAVEALLEPVRSRLRL